MIEWSRIESMAECRNSDWWGLYEQAFPPSERRSSAQHAAAMDDAAFHCFSLSDESGFAGIIAYWEWDSIAYIEHFAIVPGRRGQGLGHRVLESMSGRNLILEIEPIVDAHTARRFSFYESCGFERVCQPHLQLAYQAGQPDVPLWLMSRPGLAAGEIEDFERLYHAGPMRYRDEA